MASSSACLAAATRAWLAAAPTRGPAALAALVGPLVCSARALSSSAAASSAAGGGGAAAAPGTPDAFTAALQQKTEEELRQLALQQGQPHVAEASSTAGDQQQQGSAPSEEVRVGQPVWPPPVCCQPHASTCFGSFCSSP